MEDSKAFQIVTEMNKEETFYEVEEKRDNWLGDNLTQARKDVNQCGNREIVLKRTHVVKERQKLEKAEHVGANAVGLVDETVETAFLFLIWEGRVGT